MVNYSLFPTPLGDCGIAWRNNVVVTTSLPEETAIATATKLATRSRGSEAAPPPDIRQAIASMTALLEGTRTDLSNIPCDFSKIQPFATKVYAAARAVPAGETLTYGDIAVQLGDRLFAQRVGRILGINPFPIIVPCHRIIGANGKLTGFSAHGGVTTKLKMLTIERARIGEEPGLFD